MAVSFQKLEGSHKCGICLETNGDDHVMHAGGQAHPFHRACLKRALEERQICPSCNRAADKSSLFEKSAEGQDEQLARSIVQVDELKSKVLGTEGEVATLQLLYNEQSEQLVGLRQQVTQLTGINSQARRINNQLLGQIAQLAGDKAALQSDVKSANRKFYLAAAVAVAVIAFAIIY